MARKVAMKTLRREQRVRDASSYLRAIEDLAAGKDLSAARAPAASRGKPGPRQRSWQPMVLLPEIVLNPKAVEQAKADPKLAESLDRVREMWGNDRYTASVTRDPATKNVTGISFRRNDRSWPHDWRHAQRIKNDIAGPDCEAVELYPAEDRLVDTANQFYLWVFPPGVRFPFGFNERLVMDTGDAPDIGAVQRDHDGDTPRTPERERHE